MYVKEIFDASFASSQYPDDPRPTLPVRYHHGEFVNYDLNNRDNYAENYKKIVDGSR